MIEKAYFSNISAAWPMNRQQALVGQHERTYADKLGPTAIRRQQADALKERASLLRPTSRREGERIVFASWAVLAFDAQDLGGVIKAAAARQATLHAVHENETIEPTEAGELVAEVITRFSRRVRSGSRGRTRKEIAAEIEEATKARCALIAEDWPKRERSTPELLALAGVKPGKPMAYATACLYLGKRPKAQREYEIAANREAGRRAGKPPGRKPKA
jgi:hypothetical protein